VWHLLIHATRWRQPQTFPSYSYEEVIERLGPSSFSRVWFQVLSLIGCGRNILSRIYSGQNWHKLFSTHQHCIWGELTFVTDTILWAELRLAPQARATSSWFRRWTRISSAVHAFTSMPNATDRWYDLVLWTLLRFQEHCYCVLSFAVTVPDAGRESWLMTWLGWRRGSRSGDDGEGSWSG
jgi:hypothetical protein